MCYLISVGENGGAFFCKRRDLPVAIFEKKFKINTILPMNEMWMVQIGQILCFFLFTISISLAMYNNDPSRVFKFFNKSHWSTWSTKELAKNHTKKYILSLDVCDYPFDFKNSMYFFYQMFFSHETIHWTNKLIEEKFLAVR